MQNLKFKNEELKKAYDLCKQYNYTVLLRDPKEVIKYFTYSDGKKIAYIQDSGFSGIDISTVHKPNSLTGTGFRIHSNLVNITINHLKDGFIFCPNWGNSSTVKKYSNVEDYMKKSLFGKDYIQV